MWILKLARTRTELGRAIFAENKREIFQRPRELSTRSQCNRELSLLSVKSAGPLFLHTGVGGAHVRVPSEDYHPLQPFITGARDCAYPPTFLANLIRDRMLIRDGPDALALLAKRYQASRYNTEHFAL